MRSKIVIVLMVLGLTAFSQSEKKAKRSELKKKKTEYTQAKIHELKNTALLVRLRGYKKQIAAFEEQGNASMVKLMKSKRDELNKSIVDAFASEFDFCPVYFFYNYDTQKIKDKDFENVFVNKNLKIDSSIEIKFENFLIGEIGYAFHELDTITNIDVHPNSKIESNKRDEGNRVAMNLPVHSTSTDFVNYGFHIRNQEFLIIQKPFPGFTSGYFAFVKRSNKVVIRKTNIRLHSYLGKQ